MGLIRVGLDSVTPSVGVVQMFYRPWFIDRILLPGDLKVDRRVDPLLNLPIAENDPLGLKAIGLAEGQLVEVDRPPN